MDFITSTTQDSTCIISLNRPKVLNALSSALLAELAASFSIAKENSSVKGIIITGTGDKAFAAGADIAEFTSLSPAEASKLSMKGQQIFREIEQSPKPVVGAINGFALGGGCELAMACHMRVAAENAKFGQPEVKLGLIAGYGGTQRLTRLIGRARATEILITGKMIDAHEALDMGLVNYVTTQTELMEKCQEILQAAYQQSPHAIALTLQAIDAYFGTQQDGFALEQQLFGKAMGSADGKEGTQAFLEKRKPKFTGK